MTAGLAQARFFEQTPTMIGRSMNPRWVYLFFLAAVLGWFVSRPVGPTFTRLPSGNYTAPDWSMQDLQGRTVRSQDLRGRVVVLNFWATWCPPCRREIPELQAFQDAQGTNGAVVLGAATDEEGTALLKPFAERNKIRYPILLATAEVQSSFAVTSLPSTWIIGPTGKVQARYLGALTRKELDRAVSAVER